MWDVWKAIMVLVVRARTDDHYHHPLGRALGIVEPLLVSLNSGLLALGLWVGMID